MSKTIAEVLAALKTADPRVHVCFAFGGAVPTTISSWRGIYADPAIGWASSRDVPNPTVVDLISQIEMAIDGRTYGGYKGGNYRYTPASQLHVDNYGQCTNTEIDRIQVEEWAVTIHTQTESD